MFDTLLPYAPLGPAYDPPYDSPLEDLFAYTIVKYLDRSVAFAPQVEVNTICGRFRLDFVAATPAWTVAFECDGAEFHGTSAAASRDEWRDAMILGTGQVDAIYRLPGAGLHHHLQDVLYLIAAVDPVLFDTRGHINLHMLASPRARDHTRYESGKAEGMFQLHYTAVDGGVPALLHIERRAWDGDPELRSFTKDIFTYARQLGGGPLDDVIAHYRQTRGRIV